MNYGNRVIYFTLIFLCTHCKLRPIPNTIYSSQVTYSYDNNGNVTHHFDKYHLLISQDLFVVINNTTKDSIKYPINSRLRKNLFFSDGYIFKYNQNIKYVFVYEWRHAVAYKYKFFDQLIQVPETEKMIIPLHTNRRRDSVFGIFK